MRPLQALGTTSESLLNFHRKPAVPNPSLEGTPETAAAPTLRGMSRRRIAALRLAASRRHRRERGTAAGGGVWLGSRNDVSHDYTCFIRRGEDNVFMDVSYPFHLPVVVHGDGLSLPVLDSASTLGAVSGESIDMSNAILHGAFGSGSAARTARVS